MHAHKEDWNFFFRSHSDTQLWKFKREKNKKLAKKKRISLLLLLSMLVVGIIFASVYYAATLFFYLKYTLHRLHMVKHGVYINSMVNNKKIKRPSRAARTQRSSSTYSRGAACIKKREALARFILYGDQKAIILAASKILQTTRITSSFISISAALLFLLTCDNAKAFHYLQAPSVMERFLLRTPL